MHPCHSWQHPRNPFSNDIRCDNHLICSNQPMVICQPAGCKFDEKHSWDMKAKHGRSAKSPMNSFSEAKLREQILAAAAALDKPFTRTPNESSSQSSNSSIRHKHISLAPPSSSCGKYELMGRKRVGRKRCRTRYNGSNFSVFIDEKQEKNSPIPKTTSAKHLKNKQNIQCQDSFSSRSAAPMEVIDEEQEENGFEEGRSSSLENERSKRAQKSCADFLNIIHDTVSETIQGSVETILKDYFVKTMQRIERLVTQVARSDNLINKMYAEVMEKINEQNEKYQFQFKGLCQIINNLKKSTEFDSESPLDLRCRHVCKSIKSNCSECGSGCAAHDIEAKTDLNNQQKYTNQEAKQSKEGTLKGNNTTPCGLINTDSGRTNRSASNCQTSQRPISSDRSISNIVEQLGANRVSRISNLIEQFGDLRARHPKLIEQLDNLGLKNIGLNGQINNPGQRSSNLSEQLNINLESDQTQTQRKSDALSAMLVEKLSTDRDIINSILAEKLRSKTNYMDQVVDDHHNKHDPVKSAYQEELRTFQNGKGQHSKEKNTDELIMRRNSQESENIDQRNLIETQNTSAGRLSLFNSIASTQRLCNDVGFKETSERIATEYKCFSHAKTGPTTTDRIFDSLKS